MIITIEQLEMLGAPAEMKIKFREYGDAVLITPKFANRNALSIDFNWLAERVLSHRDFLAYVRMIEEAGALKNFHNFESWYAEPDGKHLLGALHRAYCRAREVEATCFYRAARNAEVRRHEVFKAQAC